MDFVVESRLAKEAENGAMKKSLRRRLTARRFSMAPSAMRLLRNSSNNQIRKQDVTRCRCLAISVKWRDS